MKVTNRSDNLVGYDLSELSIKREFLPGETKDISKKEIEALWASSGGSALVQDYLLVEDKTWVESHWDAPLEYFWRIEEIKKCLLEDSLELFVETLQWAPVGVLEIIKTLAWQLPIKDLNKIEAIKENLNFDVLAAVKIMENSSPSRAPKKNERLRKEEKVK